MTSIPTETEMDSDYESLALLIKRSHENLQDAALQQDALQKSINYILARRNDDHLFCDKKIYLASVHLLILFSFGESDPLEWYKSAVAQSLNCCTKCMSLFQRGRVKLKQTFTVERGVDMNSVEQFSSVILSWEAERLQKRFHDFSEQYNIEKAKDPKAIIPQELIYGIAECLYAPQMLRLNQTLKSLFESVFYSLLVVDHPFIKKTKVLSPGLIHLLFEGTDPLKKCAFNLLEGLYSEGGILDTSRPLPEILEEFEYHLVSIQDHKTYSNEKCEHFYRNIYSIVRLYNADALIDRLDQPTDTTLLSSAKGFEVKSLFKLLQHHIMAYLNEPLPYVLRFFALILEKLGNKYWSLVNPFTFENSLETITGSPYYLQNFVMLKNIASARGELNPDARLSDLFSWIQPFLATLDSSKQQQSSNRLAIYFILQVESQNSIPLINKAEMFKVACELTSSALTIPSALYSPSFRTEILSRSDARVVVTTKLIRFMDYATSAAIFYPAHERSKNSEISRAATTVIAKALRFDVLNFAQGSYDVLNNTPTSTLKFSPDLFILILKQNFAAQKELSFRLLCALENVSSVIPLQSSHKDDVAQFLGYLRQFFVRFSDIDAKNIKLILSDARSLKGYWACVFSSDENVYQSAVDILYETFDAEGRLEGVHSLLENNIESCISAINENLTNLIFLKSFYPCPRGVLVLSDVVQALNSPVNGLLGYSSAFSAEAKTALATFWNRGWSFLDLIYVETIKWAGTHENLIEFTRDTLDLSHALLGCFKSIKDLQGDNNKNAFSEITNTFPHMLSWLRLNDTGLLASCVKLISTTIDLATDLDIDFDKRAIELIARYGSRAKKFNSRLTPQQSLEIINRAKTFDKDLVESIILESENYRKAKQAASTPSTAEPTPGPKDDEDNDDVTIVSESRPRIQMKLSGFGSLSKGAPPKKKPLPKSAMEIAREGLLAAKKKTKVVHPAGPLGFNQRKRTPRPHDDSSSDDDSDNEKDSVHALFNLPPKVNSGIQVIDNLSKPKKKVKDNSRKEEEYSRLRLNVDLKPLYRRVLTWPYQREADYPEAEHREPLSVADKFSSADQYIATYEPLLLLECWKAISAAKARQTDKPLNVIIGSKSTVGDFFEVFISITKTDLNEKSFSDSDLVVLAVSENEEARPTPDMVKRSRMTCFGKIHEIKHVRGDRADLTIRIARTAALNNALTPMSTIMMMRVLQMTTVEREFSSLYGLRYYNLSKQILQAEPDSVSDISPDEVARIQKTYKVNESQAKAIGSCIDTVGFSLIQGPPGTGKTKTILGIIGHMLSSYRATSASSITPVHTLPSSTKTRKVLVCAPSNAAVDELVLRLKDGIMNSRGEKYTPKLVRLGRTDAINSAVKDMTLEELVDKELGRTSAPSSNMDSLHKQLSEIKSKITVCQAQISDENNKNIDEARKQKRALTIKANGIKKMMDDERERQNSAYRVREINRRNVQAKILGESEIICSTLSGSAHDMVANIGIKFDSVIIDEACQCTELSAIIPLRYGCNRCIMVGDPNQLPPTVLSSVAADHLYDQSLFVRMAKDKKPLLLNVQYRMNSMISRFPSKTFYDNELKDGPDNDTLTVRPWHQDALLSPYRFFDIVEGRQIQNSKTFSYTNQVEVNIAIELVSKLFREYPKFDFRNKIGVITPYKEQNYALQNAFFKSFGKSIKSEISFNTIDGFQGQEKEIIIMSCVRADAKSNSVGFLRDFRRMNVALTRPKCSLWILGNHDSLIKDSLWYDLINDAKSRDLLTETRAGFTRGVPSSAPRGPPRARALPPSGPKVTTDDPPKPSATPIVGDDSKKETNNKPIEQEKPLLPEMVQLSKSNSGYLPKRDFDHSSNKRGDKSYNNGNNLNPSQPNRSSQPATGTHLNNSQIIAPIDNNNNHNNNSYYNNNNNTINNNNNSSNNNLYQNKNLMNQSTPNIPPGQVASRSGTLPPIPAGHRNQHQKKRKNQSPQLFINKRRNRN